MPLFQCKQDATFEAFQLVAGEELPPRVQKDSNGGHFVIEKNEQGRTYRKLLALGDWMIRDTREEEFKPMAALEFADKYEPKEEPVSKKAAKRKE